MNEKEKSNLLRWDGKSRGHYEVYYIKWNDPKTRTAYWIRYTLTSPLAPIGPAYCELWGIFFNAEDPSQNFGLKERFPIESLTCDKESFRLEIDGATLHQSGCDGKLVDKEKKLTLEWNLTYDSPGQPFFHFPNPKMYTGGFPKTKVLSPHLDAALSGSMIVNGKKYDFDQTPGQQTHIWGVKHALRWAWAHCNTFQEDETAVFEALDAQIRLGLVTSPHMALFYVKAGGKDYYFNRVSQWFINHSRYELGRWEIRARNKDAILQGSIETPLDAFVGVTYTDPDGEKAWCNNSKVSTIRLDLFPTGGRAPITLTAKDSCAAEYVDRKTFDGVQIWI